VLALRCAALEATCRFWVALAHPAQVEALFYALLKPRRTVVLCRSELVLHNLVRLEILQCRLDPERWQVVQYQ
jgi:hypothetical protein